MNHHYLIRALAVMTLVPLTNLHAQRTAKDMLKSAANQASMAMGTAMDSVAVTVVNKTDYKPLVTARFKFVGKISNTKVHPVGETAKAVGPDAEVTLYSSEAVDDYKEKISDKFAEKGRLKKIEPISLKVGHKTKHIVKDPKRGYPTRFIITLKKAFVEKYRIETEDEYNSRLEKKRLSNETRVHKKN